MSRQIEKVKKYTNGSLPKSVVPVELGETTLKLINIAAWSSKAVYAAETASMNRVVPVENVSSFQPTEYNEEIDASFRDGTVKATRVQMFLNTERPAPSKLLVVAIRGSTSKRRDWTINFDDEGAGTEGTAFIDTKDCTYRVHGGFLECAKGMIEKIAKAISSILSKAEADGMKGDVQLLFTGHSAGGAVASLIAAHMMSENPSVLAQLSGKFTSINCIVFGSPPVSNSGLGLTHGPSTFLSIINEGDPVPRIDKAYIETLLIIYVSPMPISPDAKKLPEMTLENAGRVLLLKDGVQGLSAVENDPDQKKIKSILETTIFGNPRAHKMDMYLWKLGLVKAL
ncbi:Alpha/Beta hydrolase protein [Aspergillus venezuelensis]